MVVLAFLFDFAWFQSLLFASIHSCFCSYLLVLVYLIIFFFLNLACKSFVWFVVSCFVHVCSNMACLVSCIYSCCLLLFLFVCVFTCIPSVTHILNIFFVLFPPSNRNFHTSATFLSCLVLLIIVFQSERWGVFCRVCFILVLYVYNPNVGHVR